MAIGRRKVNPAVSEPNMMVMCDFVLLQNKLRRERERRLQAQSNMQVLSKNQKSRERCVVVRVRTCSRNPRMFSNLTQCSRMFSKRIVFKMKLFWPYVGINRLRHSTFLTVRQHPVSTRTRPCDPNSCRMNARQTSATCDAHFGAPKRKQPMAAFDINSPRHGAPRKLGSP